MTALEIQLWENEGGGLKNLVHLIISAVEL